jgi:hypothetical protein
LFIGISFIPATSSISDKNITLLPDNQFTANDCNIKKSVFFIQNSSRNDFFNTNDRVYISNIKSEYNSLRGLNEGDIYFTNPLNNDIFRAGDLINITGTIKDEKFKNYIIEYGQGIDPTEWLNIGIILIDGGNSPIDNDTVAIWNTSHITKPDFYTLRITTNLKNKGKSFFFEKSKLVLFPLFQRLIKVIFQNKFKSKPISIKKTNFIKNVYLDPTLKMGWPKRIEWFYNENDTCYYWGGLSEPVVSDINKDGDKEIVFYMAGCPPKLYAFKSDGSYVEGWPRYIGNGDLYGDNIGSPSIIDIDNDGYKEIIVNGLEGVHILNYNGTYLRLLDLPDSIRPYNGQEPVICDLNNDGILEVIKKFRHNDYYNELAVIDVYGNMLENWPQVYYNTTGPDGDIYVYAMECIPSVGNFDDDPEKEIVVCSPRNVFDDPNDPPGTWHCEGRIIVYNLDGTILGGFPVDVNGPFPFSAPAVADINNDGYDEIVAASEAIYVIDKSGNNLTGWPQLVGKSFSSSSAIADFNNDGYLEIVISKKYDPFYTYIFDYEGNVFSGWPQGTSWNDYRSTVVGDIDGDGNPDVVTTAGNGVSPGYYENGGVYAWNSDGNLIDGFPKVTENDAQAGATIADIDNDGDLEIVASSNYDKDLQNHKWKVRSTIYIWDLDSIFNEEIIEWPMFHHDTAHSGYFAIDFPVLIKSYMK